MDNLLDQSPLGQKSEYIGAYSPKLLFAIPRTKQREGLEIRGTLPFQGMDVWNGYELSWLNNKGKPQVAIGEFRIPCSSANLIESKSFKLYLNSFNQTKFESMQAVTETIAKDLCKLTGSSVQVSLEPIYQKKDEAFSGICLDSLDLDIDTYEVEPNLLQCSDTIVEEKVFTHLFKSNCLITGQPDWGSVSISYKGNKIDHASLLRYLVSYRLHQGFHEQCTEQIFIDLLQHCQPEKLTVYARFLRRGGLDINCIRCTTFTSVENSRLIRQ